MKNKKMIVVLLSILILGFIGFFIYNNLFNEEKIAKRVVENYIKDVSRGEIESKHIHRFSNKLLVVKEYKYINTTDKILDDEDYNYINFIYNLNAIDDEGEEFQGETNISLEKFKDDDWRIVYIGNFD